MILAFHIAALTVEISLEGFALQAALILPIGRFQELKRAKWFDLAGEIG